MSDRRPTPQDSTAPFEHVSEPVGRVLQKALKRAEKTRRISAGRRQKKMHKARRRFWGCYAKWERNPSDLNAYALTDAYSRYVRLEALESIEDGK